MSEPATVSAICTACQGRGRCVACSGRGVHGAVSLPEMDLSQAIRDLRQLTYGHREDLGEPYVALLTAVLRVARARHSKVMEPTR